MALYGLDLESLGSDGTYHEHIDSYDNSYTVDFGKAPNGAYLVCTYTSSNTRCFCAWDKALNAGTSYQYFGGTLYPCVFPASGGPNISNVSGNNVTFSIYGSSNIEIFIY